MWWMNEQTERHRISSRKNPETDTCTPMFIATLFTIAKRWKATQMSIERWLDKLNVCAYYGNLFREGGRREEGTQKGDNNLFYGQKKISLTKQDPLLSVFDGIKNKVDVTQGCSCQQSPSLMNLFIWHRKWKKGALKWVFMPFSLFRLWLLCNYYHLLIACCELGIL